MTELQFLIDLLLNHKLSAKTKAAIAERISQVELGMHRHSPPQNIAQQVVTPLSILNSQVTKTTQAPSTERILSQMVAEQIPQAPAPVAPAVPVQKQEFKGDKAAVEVIGTVTGTGSSTRGPRKW